MKVHAYLIVGLTLTTTFCRPAASSAQAQTQTNHNAKAALAELDIGPYVQYVTPSQAVVRWRTKEACSSILEYGLAGPGAKYSPSIILRGRHQGRLETRLEHKRPKKHHALKMRDLQLNEIYAYRVKVRQGDVERATEVYELDTALNYSAAPLPPDVPFAEEDTYDQRLRTIARDILNHASVTKGYCLVWGLMDGALAHAVAAQSELTVLGVDGDAGRVADVRKRLYHAGVYGAPISVQAVESLARLPYPSNFANLIVSERVLLEGVCPGQASEMVRVLRPRGGAAVLGCAAPAKDRDAAIELWLNAASLPFDKWQSSTEVFHTVTKDAPAGIGSWTHQYGDAGNTADSHDDLGGATGTDDLRVQWLGKPGADFGMDRNPRMPAPLAANGRLFHQGMNRMVALDSYNGAILWSLEIPALQRVNLPRDASNWCTDDAFLYVAIEDKCWVIEHYNGSVEHVLELPAVFPGHEYDWGYLARQDDLLFASAVRKNTIYTDFWGGDAWYDKTTGPGTEKVCSDALFACDVRTKKLLWTWRSGLIVNTTVAVGQRGVYFVESRNEKLRQSQTRRLNDSLLWSEQYLVALHPKTGEPRWEVPIDTADGIVVFFLVCREDAIVIASSAAGKYHLYKFDASTGELLWHAEHKWPSDNHGGHMQHPVVLADKVFLEPCGYDLKTGTRITSAMSGREGCATYCGTKHALVHRGQSRRVTMWDFTTGRITSWHNLRPSCWLSTIAGEGMVLSPEAGGGCSCGNWLETSLAFAPRERTTAAGAAQAPIETK
jgi:outer membrane protein assembly factor BamB